MMISERQLRDERIQRITREAALKKAEIETQLLESYGAILPAHAALLDALLDVEIMRLEAAECVAEKGQKERYSNGKQTLERKNPAVDTMLRASATEAKLISALGLNRRKRPGKADVEPDDPLPEDDDVSDLDDY